MEIVFGLLVFSLVFGLAGFYAARRTQRLVDLPTSKAAGVFIGRNEVKGRAHADHPSPSYLTQTPCVHWTYTLEEEREHTRTVTDTDSKGNTTSRTETYRQWHVVDQRGSTLGLFEVVDDSGSVPIVPHGAKLVPRSLVSTIEHHHRHEGGFFAQMFHNGTGRYRYTENAIAVGDELYVVGEARLQGDSAVPQIGDGEGQFLISTKAEEQHQTNWKRATAVGVIGAGGLWTFAVVQAVQTGFVVTGIVAAVVGLILATTGWAILTWNALVAARGYAQRAWSLIEVQLARRRDLIPALVESARAHASHEQELLETVGQLRALPAGSGRSVTDANREATLQQRVLDDVFAVAERHPEVGSHYSFTKLQAELADTENRIAAAREFYNDSVTSERNRAHAFPGLLIARFGGFGQTDLFAADGFARHELPKI